MSRMVREGDGRGPPPPWWARFHCGCSRGDRVTALELADLRAARDVAQTYWKVVLMGRIELPTSPLPRECSATELHGPHTRNLERVKGIEPSS